MTPEARAARERKQKIFVLVGGLFLLALLAFQLPKLLGGSSSPEATATTTAAAPVAGEPVVGTTPSPVASGAPVATAGKITSFGVFSRKDPFVQQAVTPAPAADGAVQGDGGGKGGADKTPATGFTTAPVAPAQTVVSVNGARQVLDEGKRFPKSDPLFVLVSASPQAKSARIGIAGGAYSSGDRTTTLKVGKPLTLVNTATGAKYKIVLVSVGSGGSAGESRDDGQK
jgi:hypothetical protein